MKTNKSKFSSYFGAAILPGAPANSVAPTITGTAQVGQTLTSVAGTWSGSPTYARRWRADGIEIPGAVGATYVPIVADIGKLITVEVTGSNAFGVKPLVSAATAAVIAA